MNKEVLIVKLTRLINKHIGHGVNKRESVDILIIVGLRVFVEWWVVLDPSLRYNLVNHSFVIITETLEVGYTESVSDISEIDSVGAFTKFELPFEDVISGANCRLDKTSELLFEVFNVFLVPGFLIV